MKNVQSSFYILLAAVLWGTTGTARSFAPESAHPLAIGAVRLAIGGGILLLFASLRGNFSLKNWPFLYTILASLTMALFQPLFFSAVSLAGVAIGTVVAIGSAPLFAGLIEWLLLRKAPHIQWWIATGLSIIGCLFIFVTRETVQVNPVGLLLALGAGFSFASYTLINRKLVTGQSTLLTVAIIFSLAALLLFPFMFFFDMSWMKTPQGLGVSLHLGIVATGIAYLLFTRGLIHVSPSTAVTLSLAEPLTATLLGVFVLKETLILSSWIGIGLLLTGLGILLWSQKDTTNKRLEKEKAY